MELQVIYQGHNIDGGGISNVANPRECMRICQYYARCVFWSYSTSRNCYLKDRDAIASRVSDSSHVSGPKYCDDMKYHGINSWCLKEYTAGWPGSIFVC